MLRPVSAGAPAAGGTTVSAGAWRASCESLYAARSLLGWTHLGKVDTPPQRLIKRSAALEARGRETGDVFVQELDEVVQFDVGQGTVDPAVASGEVGGKSSAPVTASMARVRPSPGQVLSLPGRAPFPHAN
ncbi:hypothetical protein [Streptomyces sviceus]|uniref:hypothetical protein n=1 Tax=Streptomyces sviceus TaxID=285530 RepID=UPI00367967CC